MLDVIQMPYSLERFAFGFTSAILSCFRLLPVDRPDASTADIIDVGLHARLLLCEWPHHVTTVHLESVKIIRSQCIDQHNRLYVR